MSHFWNIFSECAVPLAVLLFFLGALGAGLLVSVPDLLPLAALLALPLLIAATNLSVLLCFAVVVSCFSLALALSRIEFWRMAILFLTFLLPSLLLTLYRGYPGKVCKMIARFCEESAEIDSVLGVCSLAVRVLRSCGFFKHVALLQWNRETDCFKIAAATGAYEIGAEMPCDSTFYVKCHVSSKPARFRDPYSSLYFLPSNFTARSAICAPLHLGGKRFGVLVAESGFSRPWSRGSRQILQFFAMILSYAMAEMEARDATRRGAGKRAAFPAGKST